MTDGAKHASELPFVVRYGGANAAGFHGRGSGDGPGSQYLLVDFAKSGNPDSASLRHWPRYQRSEDVLMDFTSDGPESRSRSLAHKARPSETCGTKSFTRQPLIGPASSFTRPFRDVPPFIKR